MKLCTLWDSANSDRESIPSIIALVDDNGVLTLIAQQTRDSYLAKYSHLGEELAQKAVTQLREGIADAKAVMNSDRMKRLRDHRDGFLAHALADTVRAQNPPAKYGDERRIFEETEPIINKFYSAINGTGYAWSVLHEQVDRQTAELWTNSHFTEIPTRL